MVRVLHDDFDSLATGAQLHGRSPSYVNPNIGAPAWAVFGPTTMLGAEILSPNQGVLATEAAGGSIAEIAHGLGTANHAAFVDFTPGGADNRCTLLVRGDEVSVFENHYRLNIRTGENALRLLKQVGGVTTVLASDYPFTINSSAWYTFGLKFEAGSPNTLTVYAAAQGTKTVQFSATDSSNWSGGDYVGFLHNLRTDGNARFDNFELDNLVPLHLIYPPNSDGDLR